MSAPTTVPVPRGSYLVALVLAIGMATALNLFSFAVLADALFSAGPGLSENATQILTGWGGGVIGVIGAVVGYGAGAQSVRSSGGGASSSGPAPTMPEERA